MLQCEAPTLTAQRLRNRKGTNSLPPSAICLIVARTLGCELETVRGFPISVLRSRHTQARPGDVPPKGLQEVEFRGKRALQSLSLPHVSRTKALLICTSVGGRWGEGRLSGRPPVLDQLNLEPSEVRRRRLEMQRRDPPRHQERPVRGPSRELSLSPWAQLVGA